MLGKTQIAALAAIAAAGLALTTVPAAAWYCHGSYQSYSYYPQQQYYQSYSQNYYYPRHYPRYYQNYQQSYNYPPRQYYPQPQYYPQNGYAGGYGNGYSQY